MTEFNVELDMHDRILDAYNGELGEEFKKATKQRIEWICSNVRSNKILDIGCSQGLVPVLLAKKCKQVVGVDKDAIAITQARKFISEKNSEIKNLIELKQCDYLKLSLDEKFDCILMTEVLEHLRSPKSFVKKAFKDGSQKSKLIITVPFGINDHPDHKKTFYLNSLCQMIFPYYEIRKIHIIDKWLGVICIKRDEIENKKKWMPELSNLKLLESSFFKIERSLTDSFNDFYKKLNAANSKYRITIKQVSELREKIENYKEIEKDSEKNITEIKKINQEKLTLLNRINELSEKVTKFPELKEENFILRDKIKHIENELALVSKVEEYNEELQSKNLDLKARIVLLEKTEKEYSILEAEVKELRAQAALLSVLEKDQIKLVEQNKALKTEVLLFDKVKLENQELQGELENLTAEVKCINELQNNIERITKEK